MPQRNSQPSKGRLSQIRTRIRQRLLRHKHPTFATKRLPKKDPENQKLTKQIFNHLLLCLQVRLYDSPKHDDLHVNSPLSSHPMHMSKERKKVGRSNTITRRRTNPTLQRGDHNLGEETEKMTRDANCDTLAFHPIGQSLMSKSFTQKNITSHLAHTNRLRSPRHPYCSVPKNSLRPSVNIPSLSGRILKPRLIQTGR